MVLLGPMGFKLDFEDMLAPHACVTVAGWASAPSKSTEVGRGRRGENAFHHISPWQT